MADEKPKRKYVIKDPENYARIRKEAAAKAHATRDHEQYRQAGLRGGTARMAALTQEQRRELSRRATRARWPKNSTA